MAYDETLAERIRDALVGVPEVTERKMFGGIAFMVAGNMAVGVIGSDLMARIGPEAATAALAEDGVRPMDFTGKPMKNMVYVDESVTADDAALRDWVARCVERAESLPPK
jgi:TfoX/Sxy family transcriptional regulator of competence genes